MHSLDNIVSVRSYTDANALLDDTKKILEANSERDQLQNSSSSVALVLCDFDLSSSSINGWQVHAKLQQLYLRTQRNASEARKKPIFVLMTIEEQQTETKLKAYELGIDFIVSKPLDRAMLLKIMQASPLPLTHTDSKQFNKTE